MIINKRFFVELHTDELADFISQFATPEQLLLYFQKKSEKFKEVNEIAITEVRTHHDSIEIQVDELTED